MQNVVLDYTQSGKADLLEKALAGNYFWLEQDLCVQQMSSVMEHVNNSSVPLFFAGSC